MKLNPETLISNIHNIIRGETAGSTKFLAAFLLALAVWTGTALTASQRARALGTLNAQTGRFSTLLALGAEYTALEPSSRGTGTADTASVFAQVSERMQLGNRVNRTAPDGRNQTVEINRLYAEELAELQRQLSARGVRFIAAELRAIPSGSERLFSVNAVIGPVN